MTHPAPDRSPASQSLRREAGTAPRADPHRRPQLVIGIIVALLFFASVFDAIAWNQSGGRTELRRRADAAELRARTAEARARAAETRAAQAEALAAKRYHQLDELHTACTGVSIDGPH